MKICYVDKMVKNFIKIENAYIRKQPESRINYMEEIHIKAMQKR